MTTKLCSWAIYYRGVLIGDESIQNRGVLIGLGLGLGLRDEGGLVPKLVWQVKLVAELRPGVMTETEVARIERDEQVGLAELGLQLTEAKQLTAALQALIVPAQVAVLGERRRSCIACGRVLASKGHCRFQKTASTISK